MQGLGCRVKGSRVEASSSTWRVKEISKVKGP